MKPFRERKREGPQRMGGKYRSCKSRNKRERVVAGMGTERSGCLLARPHIFIFNANSIKTSCEK